MLFKYFTIFGFSLLLNSFFFILIKLGLLGNITKDKFNSLVKNQINKLTFLTFLFVLLFLFYLQLNFIHLDNDVEVKAMIDGVDVTLTGQFLQKVCAHFGEAAVFTAGLRVSHLIVSKNMPLIGKIGLTGLSATGYSLTYRVITNKDTISSITDALVLRAKIIELFMEYTGKAEKLVNNEGSKVTLTPYVERFLGNNYQALNIKNNFYSDTENNLKTITEKNLQSSSNVLKELDASNPDWRQNFSISSPLENSENLGLNNAIELLNANLSLHYIIVYLLFMLLVIFTSKLLVEKNTKLDIIKKLPLGYYIHFIFNKLINIWKVNANVWIYFIVINVTVFTYACSYSLYTILTILKSL